MEQVFDAVLGMAGGDGPEGGLDICERLDAVDLCGLDERAMRPKALPPSS